MSLFHNDIIKLENGISTFFTTGNLKCNCIRMPGIWNILMELLRTLIRILSTKWYLIFKMLIVSRVIRTERAKIHRDEFTNEAYQRKSFTFYEISGHQSRNQTGIIRLYCDVNIHPISKLDYQFSCNLWILIRPCWCFPDIVNHKAVHERQGAPTTELDKFLFSLLINSGLYVEMSMTLPAMVWTGRKQIQGWCWLDFGRR